MMILSNIMEDGKPIGLADAGTDPRAEKLYSRDVAFANVLYGIKIPHRNGVALGGTQFANMHAAYDDLPQDLKSELAKRTATHDFNKFWEAMRREKGSKRPPLSEEQPQEASRVASDLHHPPDHRKARALRESRLHDGHRRDGSP